MTAQPVETQPDDGWTGYEAALAAVTLAAVVEAAAVFDRLVPPGLLVEEVPDRVRGLLVAALVRSWLAYRARAAALASVSAAGWLAGVRGWVVEPMLPPPPSADRDRLRVVADVVLDRAASLGLGQDDADATPVPPGDHVERDLAEVQARAVEEARQVVAEIEARFAQAEAEARAAEEAEAAALRAELADLDRLRAAEEAAEREAIEALARADALAAAEDARREAAADAERDRSEQRAAFADDRARDRAVAMAEARERRAQAEDRAERRRAATAARRREARRTRREAQRARVERVARGEVAEGAADVLAVAFANAAEVVGWVRKLDRDPCSRCLGWFNSGGDRRGPTPVRGYDIPMKRHRACGCVQRPVRRDEAEQRGFTDEPEPVIRKPRAPRRRAGGGPDPDGVDPAATGVDTGA